ncbi:hypothetical protein R3P38DRAFT_274983 [Favolaschia claudopus]|uniref:Uncharacterized protein n=1 Tax=Favolaschia claudopus TaxID=2862362 RepID=A0AAV9ZQ84_9AGAR
MDAQTDSILSIKTPMEEQGLSSYPETRFSSFHSTSESSATEDLPSFLPKDIYAKAARALVDAQSALYAASSVFQIPMVPVAEANKRADLLNAEIATFRATLTEERGRSSTLQKSLDSVLRSQELANAQMIDARKRIKGLEVKHAGVQLQLAMEQAQTSSLKKSLDSAKKKHDARTKDIQDFQQAQAILRSKLAALQAENASLKQTLIETTEERDSFKHSLVRYSSELRSQQAALAKSEDARRVLRTELDAVRSSTKKDMDLLRKQLACVKEERNSLANRVSRRDARIQELKDSRDSAVKACDTAVQEQERYRRSISDALSGMWVEHERQQRSMYEFQNSMKGNLSRLDNLMGKTGTVPIEASPSLYSLFRTSSNSGLLNSGPFKQTQTLSHSEQWKLIFPPPKRQTYTENKPCTFNNLVSGKEAPHEHGQSKKAVQTVFPRA